MKKTNQQYIQIIGFLLMVVTCIIALLPTKTWAAETKTYGDFKYCYNEEYEGIEILKYKGKAETVKIPESIEGIPVKVIGYRSFSKNRLGKKTKH